MDQTGSSWIILDHIGLKMDLIGSFWSWKIYGLDKHDMVLKNMIWSWKKWHGLEMVFISFWRHPPAVLDLTLNLVLPAFYLIMCLMKSPKNFEKIPILKMWELIFFLGVKIHFSEKYAWFAIEIWIQGSKTCLLYMLWSQNIVKKSSRSNRDYIYWEQ